MLNHAVLINPSLTGFEFGMLCDFQDEIARLTQARMIEVPPSRYPAIVARKLAHGTRYARYRPIFRRSGYKISADVLWVVLMGPENWSLDLFRRWDTKVGFKILYLFDTLEHQLPSIHRLLRSTRWDLTISSFSGAVPMLESETGRRWFAVPQGVNLRKFAASSPSRRVIDFCSYGRRLDRIHQSLRAFCETEKKYYEYTTTTGLMSGIRPSEQYQQYAWHLRHSAFNICWPVEITNPRRAITFSPITCRWFEAAASGNVVVGKAPSDPGFRELFGADFVLELNPELPQVALEQFWHKLCDDRDRHLLSAQRRYAALAEKWSWKRRVRDILHLAALPAPNNGSEDDLSYERGAQTLLVQS